MYKIAVIGAGTMGNGIAHLFAQHGYPVQLIDTSGKALEKGLNSISKNLERMVGKEKMTADDATATLQRITAGTNLSEGVSHVDMVIEAVVENAGIKREIFKKLDEFCGPETILATNTSSISITNIAAATSRPENVIGMHFMNPVPVMKLVEVIRGYDTSDKVTRKVLEMAAAVGKTATVVSDYPGFIANRLLMPMINEAIEALYHRVAGVMEIDTIMKQGMAHPMGPLQLADFIGLDVCLSIMEVLYEGFRNPKYAPCPLLVTMVTAGKLGVKSGEGFYDYSTTTKAEVISRQFIRH